MKKETELYNTIYNFLNQELGIPTRYRGFAQLIDVVKEMVLDTTLSAHSAYELVAKKYNVTLTCIGNNIGKVVNVASGIMEPEKKEQYFKAAKYTGGYITAATLINSVVAYIRNKM